MIQFKTYIERAKKNKAPIKTISDQKNLYYKEKNKFETVMKIVNSIRVTIDAKESSKPIYKIGEKEKQNIDTLVKKYQNYKTDGGDPI